MKFYLAARYGRREELLEYAKRLRGLGHEITARWLYGSHEAADDDKSHWKDFAQDDFDDIIGSDVLISFTEHELHPRGSRHVEFGIALRGGQRLVVIGPVENVFHAMPEVLVYPDWETFLEIDNRKSKIGLPDLLILGPDGAWRPKIKPWIFSPRIDAKLKRVLVAAICLLWFVMGVGFLLLTCWLLSGRGPIVPENPQSAVRQAHGPEQSRRAIRNPQSVLPAVACAGESFQTAGSQTTRTREGPDGHGTAVRPQLLTEAAGDAARGRGAAASPTRSVVLPPSRTSPPASAIADRPAFSPERRPTAGQSGISPGLRPLFDAIRMVEASGSDNPADGDDGLAIGPYQIWRVHWIDARMPHGRYQDCRNRAYAEEVMIRYWRRYAPAALAECDYETLARLHKRLNIDDPDATAYWAKVSPLITRIARISRQPNRRVEKRHLARPITWK